MGLNYRKRIRLGKNSGVNLSTGGVSFSQKVGPVTFNSRGRTTVRLGRGWSYTSGGCSGCGCLIALVGIAALVRFFWFFLGAAVVAFICWKLFSRRAG